MLQDGLRIFRVSRPSNKLNFLEVGYNAVVVIAKNEIQAKGIAIDSTSSLVDSWPNGVTKKDLIITDITDELELGYVIAKE